MPVQTRSALYRPAFHHQIVRLGVLALVVLAVAAVLSGSVMANEPHQHGGDGPARPESERQSPIPLNPSAGRDIGLVFQAFPSPHQQGGEEEDTPGLIPQQFRSTAPSVPRNQRPSRGHVVIEFANDLSRAYVYGAVENINPEDVVMMHLHCGRPGQLGPIIIDFGMAGRVSEYLADGMFALEITNEDVMAVTSHSSGLIDAFTLGCPIVPEIPNDKVKNIAGLAYIARQGDLYFNLHTKGQTYFGDIRGLFLPVELE
jgi:hypothetical protein